MRSYNNFKRKLLKNKEIKKAYQGLDFEFSLIKTLIQRRTEKGLTQKDLASSINMKQSSIARLESGNYNPTVLFLSKILKPLGGRIEIVFNK
jgi:DNA-binding XRE family transcriptional regulator